MKQLQQSLKSGQTELIEIPLPTCTSGEVRIRSCCSLISAGTERMLVNFGKANLLGKARQQPDKVRQVTLKAKTDGLPSTIKSVRTKLNTSIPMGYSNVGIIETLGDNVSGYSIGDRVISNGPHAEIVISPKNLIARIPDNVSNEKASFTVVGAIALQGVRLARVALGEYVAVFGLGLIGLLTVQILRAQGCQVIGFDYDESKLSLARSFGAKTFNLSKVGNGVEEAMAFSSGRGVDAVLLSTATESDEPLRSAANMSKQRGRIILVGTSGLNLSRDDFYKKELSFQVSCSYGPGRYDESYEQKGLDYPYAYVRWTEQRNFEAVLQLMADGKLDPTKLITHRYKFDDAADAYALLGQDNVEKIGILLDYLDVEEPINLNSTISYHSPPSPEANLNEKRIAFIGSGNYATSVLIPAFKSSKASLHSISSQYGMSAANAARRFGFSEATSDVTKQLSGDADAVVITTRHDTHAEMVIEALNAGKHVFVEKPLCLNAEELSMIEETLRSQKERSILMVGYNRRFAPLVKKMRSLLLSETSTKTFIYTVNAGAIPSDHWIQDKKRGGGRLIGEACHFIDLLRFLADSPIKNIVSTKMDIQTDDVATVTMHFMDGSIGTVHYLSNGHKAVAKERLEVFVSGKNSST